MKLEALLKLANEKRAEAARGKNVDIQAAMVQAYAQVVETLAGTVEIQKPQDLFECCERLDQLTVDPRIEAVFHQARADILPLVLNQLYREEKAKFPLKRGEQDRSLELSKEQSLWRLTARFLEIVKKEKPETFGPSWIQTNARDIYDQLLPLIRDPRTNASHWELFKEHLPQSWQDRFLSEKHLSQDEKISRDIEEYRQIAEVLGPEALAEFLLILNPGTERDFSKIMRIITQYLGRSEVRGTDFKGLRELPEEALQLEGFRELVFIRLRNHIYRELVKTHETDTDRQRVKLEEIEDVATRVLDASKPAHKALLKELMDYYRRVLAIKTPARVVTALRDKAGEFHPFPSLRQRIAMKEMERDPHKHKYGRLLVSFFMGGGKTATSFLAKEHLGAKRMLYLCPNSDLVAQTAERVEKYYQRGKEPSVGTITSGMDEATVLENLKHEVVIVPFSMFSATVGKKRLVDVLKSQNFDMVTVDEVHNARKDEGRNTDTIYELVAGIPDLYEKGHVMLLSGDPVPNSPDNIAPQLRIYDKETYSDVGSLGGLIRRTDPLRVRNALLKFLLILDEPENWQEYVETLPFELSEEESQTYHAILEDTTIPLTRKLEYLRLAIVNPRLFDESYNVDSTLAQEVALRITEDFEQYAVVMIGENSYKGGILRPHQEHAEVPTFVERVRALVGGNAYVVPYDKKMKNRGEVETFVTKARRQSKTPVITAIYDGDTSEGDRKDILQLSKEAEALGIKMVIFAMIPTVREGIDLSHINRAYALAPEFNQPDLVQWIKRFAREGNTEAKVGVFVAPGTILEGIHLHALQKAILCDRLKYGGTLTEVELAFLQDDLGENVRIQGGKVIFGTHITDKLLTDAQRLEKVARYLNGKGAEEYEKLMEVYGENYAEMYAKDWDYTFSANNGRFVAGLVNMLKKKRLIIGNRFADVACGPMVLANTLGLENGDVHIDSFDANPYMLMKGATLQAQRRAPVGKFLAHTSRLDRLTIDKIPVPDGSYDCVNLANALTYTNVSVKKKDPKNDERARTLLEQNRILTTGGVLIITLPTNAGSEDEFTALTQELENFGFRVLKDYIGYGKADGQADNSFENFTIVCEKSGPPNLDSINIQNLKLTPLLLPVASSKRSQKRALHTEFSLNKKKIDFSTAYDEQRKGEERKYGQQVRGAQELLEAIYRENGNKWKLTSSQKVSLKSNGIVLSKPQKAQEPWRFSLTSRPEEKYPLLLE